MIAFRFGLHGSVKEHPAASIGDQPTLLETGRNRLQRKQMVVLRGQMRRRYRLRAEES
jgi:hypothetical protein